MSNSEDISSNAYLKQRLLELTAENEQYKEIIDKLPIHIYWKGRDGLYLGCNELQAKSLGLKSAGDIVGKKSEEIHDEQAATIISKNDEKVFNQKHPITVEESCVDSDSHVQTYISSKTPLLDENGEVRGLLGASTNISKQKELEKELKLMKTQLEANEKLNREYSAQLHKLITGQVLPKNASISFCIDETLEFLENIIAKIPGHVYWFDKNNVFLGCNDEQARSAGMDSRKDIIGKTYFDMPWKETAQEHIDYNNIVMKTRKTHTQEEIALIDGVNRTFLSKKSPLYDKRGEVVGVLGVSMDITPQKQLEQMTTKAETLKLIAASMAHELRTPLRAIQLAASGINEDVAILIDSYKADKEARGNSPEFCEVDLNTLEKLCEITESETRAAFNVIDMMLVKTDPDELKKSKPSLYSIAKCLDKVISRYPFEDSEKSFVKIDCSQDFDFYGGENAITHVFFNLLKNAIYAVRSVSKGGITIKTELGEKYNKVYFRDTGAGIAPDVLPRIFDQFYTQTNHGTGVGLAFCKLVMEDMGGGIDCSSVEGEYTEFTLAFPIVE